MKIPKKFKISLGVVGFLFASVFMMPMPIEGNWSTTAIECLCSSHNFLRFEDGKVLYIGGNHPPPEWIGTYEKMQWGKYKVILPLSSGEAFEVHPKLFHLQSPGLLADTWRDFFFWRTSKILRDPSQYWVNDLTTLNVVVRGEGREKTCYFGEKELTAENFPRLLDAISERNLLKDKTFLFYVGHDGIPKDFLEMISSRKLDYEVRSNTILQREL
jgi:hypothetical protein